MIMIVASTIDVASMNIAKQIQILYDFEKTTQPFHENPIYAKNIEDKEVKLVFLNEDLIHAQHITNHFTPQLLIFASRHASESGIPTLSVHTPGNLDKAEKGGVPRKISISPASAMKNALQEMAQLKEEKKLDYKVSYECTHHGPSLDVPTMFAELGSQPEQWKDTKAAEIVAHSIMKAATTSKTYPTALGVGGPHYNETFTKIALTSSTAFGHIIPKYAVAQAIQNEMLKPCIERTVEKVSSVILDWKGIKGEDKKKLMEQLRILNIPVEKA
jgi:D-aminoacyl-tRNA deacylase